MKFLFVFLLCLFTPISIFARSMSSTEILSTFSRYIQEDTKSEGTINGVYVKYTANESTLTDTLTYTSGKQKWVTKGPWSLASESMRNKVKKCKKQNSTFTASSCGWYDYSILRLSPSANYVELVGIGYESTIWRMLDTKTGKIILSNDNGIVKSMWTADKKQFIWQTGECEIGGCTDPVGTFLTEYGKFPKYKKLK